MTHLFENHPLPLWSLVPAILLVAIYTMLSWLAFRNQTFFFESMAIPIPEHFFMIWSWGGKNTAMVVVLLLSLISRRALPLVIACAMLLTGQIGDVNAGVRTNVNVFVTWIAFVLTCAQITMLYAALILRKSA
ncbi:MAG: hypothetical protein AAGA87_09270 [Pseudomonadota bacterium]